MFSFKYEFRILYYKWVMCYFAPHATASWHYKPTRTRSICLEEKKEKSCLLGNWKPSAYWFHSELDLQRLQFGKSYFFFTLWQLVMNLLHGISRNFTGRCLNQLFLLLSLDKKMSFVGLFLSRPNLGWLLFKDSSSSVCSTHRTWWAKRSCCEIVSICFVCLNDISWCCF